MKKVFRFTPAFALVVMLYGSPRSAHAQLQKWTTTITSPADKAAVTPDPQTGFITVSGDVAWSGLFGYQPSSVKVTLTDSNGMVISTDSTQTKPVQDPNNPKRITWTNAQVGQLKTRGKYTIDAQPVDGQMHLIGTKTTISVT